MKPFGRPYRGPTITTQDGSSRQISQAKAPAVEKKPSNPYDRGNMYSVPAHVAWINGRWEVRRDDGKPLTYFTHS